MIDALAWLKKWGWLILSGIGSVLGAILLGWMRRPTPETTAQTEPPRADLEREADEKKAAIQADADAQYRALKLRAIAERARQEAARRVREQAIRRRALEASPDELRQELLDGAKEILEGDKNE